MGGAAESVLDRIITNILVGVLAIVLPVFANLFAGIESATSTAAYIPAFFALLFSSAPGLITLAGLIAALVYAGPPGFIGVILEIIAVNQIINGTGGVGLLFIGGILVVSSSFVPWMEVYAAMLERR